MEALLIPSSNIRASILIAEYLQHDRAGHELWCLYHWSCSNAERKAFSHAKRRVYMQCNCDALQLGQYLAANVT